MGEMGGPVERAFIVSVEDLREICSGLTEDNGKDIAARRTQCPQNSNNPPPLHDSKE